MPKKIKDIAEIDLEIQREATKLRKLKVKRAEMIFTLGIMI